MCEERLGGIVWVEWGGKEGRKEMGYHIKDFDWVL